MWKNFPAPTPAPSSCGHVAETKTSFSLSCSTHRTSMAGFVADSIPGCYVVHTANPSMSKFVNISKFKMRDFGVSDPSQVR